jgi:hypothetical protein
MSFVKNQPVMFFDGNNWQEAKFAFEPLRLQDNAEIIRGGFHLEFVPLDSLMTVEEYQNSSTAERGAKEALMNEAIRQRMERKKKEVELEARKPAPKIRAEQENNDKYLIYYFLFWGLVVAIVLYELQIHYHMFRGDE